eukprot:TRINITY_DN10890_c0_g1_i1.p1 TRINITY_DN10890_c0_g1~~TRINITY_DN10890_c0_g1_i1.p1  ORF type:complete len:108 (+),score=15.66 TRINITY_DN10890_c0_g1_i1:174-497(+)
MGTRDLQLSGLEVHPIGQSRGLSENSNTPSSIRLKFTSGGQTLTFFCSLCWRGGGMATTAQHNIGPTVRLGAYRVPDHSKKQIEKQTNNPLPDNQSTTHQLTLHLVI